MIMKTRYFKLVTVCLLAVSLFASCLGDLDTLPLDDNELTGEMVYSLSLIHISEPTRPY